MSKQTLALTLLLSLSLAGMASAQGAADKWLAVEITNESGQPLKNACVTFVPKKGEIVFRKADRRGHVKFRRPPVGDYRVVVKVDGYEAQKKQVTIGDSSATVAFALKTNGSR